ncbi:GntR family transcriptional regulator [Nocardia camponoti]|uniref:HTH gntR-type domain-containing protein n=1 Tax=Nocardia camponoti TaxID=1616106 RepID=A0A917V9V0_9NOCA|nr:GntR family transcriptional regulator [Nocardia camponoti]GGK54019.1 hypothetical protein GCM10011591_27260 [Nocardia camponoti]
MGAHTVVAEVADELARRVAIGEYQPGDLMPSVRQVAEEFEMNRATAQLTLGRLESYGFVEALRGRGFAVLDVRREGGMDAYRHLFRFAADVPELASGMFADLVETERGIIADALLCYTDLCYDDPDAAVDIAELTAAIDELESLARADLPDHAAMLNVEMAVTRSLLGALGMGVQRAVLNSIADMVLEVPTAVSAYFAVAPDLHVAIWRGLLAAWAADAPPTEAQLALFDDLFALYHAKVTARFEQLLGVHEPAAEVA